LAKTLRFHCERCGFCCRHLLVDIDGGKGTLFLLPSETKLFPKDLIKPFFGSGTKGRSRPRPATIFAYQIATNVCPHIKPDNQCAIYENRPLMCQSYPFEGMGIVLIHRECPTIAKSVKEGEIIENIIAPEEKKANTLLARYTWKHVGSPMWYFDLKNQKWKILPTNKILKRLPI